MTTPQPVQPTQQAEPIIAPAVPPTPPEPIVVPIEPTMPKKSPLVFILSAFLVLALGATIYFFLQARPRSEAETPPLASSVGTPTASADPTTNWQTYTDPNNNISFRHSQLWQFTETPGINLLGNIVNIQISLSKGEANIRMHLNMDGIGGQGQTYEGKEVIVGGHDLFQFEKIDNGIKTIGISNSANTMGVFQINNIVHSVRLTYPVSFTQQEQQSLQDEFTQILSTFQFTDQITSTLPNGWTYQHTQDCNTTIPTPPIIADEDNRQWTMEQHEAQPFGLWEGKLYQLIHRNPEEASGYISGMVSVSCGLDSGSKTTTILLSEIQQHLEVEKAKNNDSDFIIQVASVTDTQKWGLSVKELTFSGGMYNPTQKYYLFAKDNYWYLITSKSDSISPAIQSQTSQILDLLQLN